MSDEGIWVRIARLVNQHPVRVFAASAAVILLPALAAPTVALSYDTLSELPDDSESVRSFEVLADHFPPGELSPVLIVVEDEAAVTRPASMRALGDLSKNLRRLPSVASVRSVAMPTNGEAPELGEAQAAELDRLESFDEELVRAADGARRLEDGLRRLVDGLTRVDRELPTLDEGLAEARRGVGQLLDGVREARDGAGKLADGARRLQDGIAEARDGAARLRDDVAIPAEASIRAAWETLTEDFTVGRADPAYADALEQVGQTYGRLTGEDPRTGEPVEAGYDGLAAALDELATGLDEVADGAGRLADGTAELQDGLGRVEQGLVALRDGLDEAAPGVDELRDGIDRLLSGARRLQDGADQLATRLQEGATEVEKADLGSLVSTLAGSGAEGEEAGPFVVTAGLLDAVPDLREDLGLFLARDDTTTRIFVGLTTDPFANASVAAIDDIRETTALSLRDSPLQDATVHVTGISALFDAVDTTASGDLPLLVTAVVIGVFLVLVLLLRALVAPIYMVLTVLLSFGAALGLTSMVFTGLLGHEALAWWLPPFLFVLLVALGADYNIYLMSRVREEAETKPTRRAVADATRSTGGVITSAGLILAGTFAALMAARVDSLVQMGFATTMGILLDTFVVRTLLVPSLATLLGRHNWWPGRRARASAEPDPGVGDREQQEAVSPVG